MLTEFSHVCEKRVLVARPGGFTSAVYQELNGVDRDVAYRRLFSVKRHQAVLELQKLRDAGILQQRGEKRAT